MLTIWSRALNIINCSTQILLITYLSRAQSYYFHFILKYVSGKSNNMPNVTQQSLQFNLELCLSFNRHLPSPCWVSALTKISKPMSWPLNLLKNTFTAQVFPFHISKILDARCFHVLFKYMTTFKINNKQRSVFDGIESFWKFFKKLG